KNSFFLEWWKFGRKSLFYGQILYKKVVIQNNHINLDQNGFIYANDLGSTMMEENVVSAAGASYRMNQDEMIRLIKSLGENPAKR
ncbi:hypothetical protein VWM68_10130, partial [Campylobacter coli]